MLHSHGISSSLKISFQNLSQLLFVSTCECWGAPGISLPCSLPSVCILSTCHQQPHSCILPDLALEFSAPKLKAYWTVPFGWIIVTESKPVQRRIFFSPNSFFSSLHDISVCPVALARKYQKSFLNLLVLSLVVFNPSSSPAVPTFKVCVLQLDLSHHRPFLAKPASPSPWTTQTTSYLDSLFPSCLSFSYDLPKH